MTRARDVANLIGSGNYSSTTFTATAGQTAFTISHTQGFVQVFMNGLLLDETVDYTSNGSAVTLTSGAAAGDEIEVVAYNTFSVGDALPKSGGAMTGALTVDAAGATPLTVDRATSDGTIINVQKDGTTVGIVGSVGGTNMRVGSGDVGVRFDDGSDVITPWNTSTNSARGSAIDLGHGNAKFKDLYLSGGAYLGGTAATNHLDDYEEGTWTPTLTTDGGGSATYTSRLGWYRKVGNIVVAGAIIYNTAHSGSGLCYITGLPFAHVTGYESVGTAQMNIHGDSFSSKVCSLASIIQANQTKIHMRGTYYDTTAGPYYVNLQNFTYLRITITYPTG